MPPWVTICWKSRIPSASIRLRSDSLFLTLHAELVLLGNIVLLGLAIDRGDNRRRQLDGVQKRIVQA